MFMASGSVIYGCHHVQEMPQMGGLIRKMPITAITMLVGVIAISGLAIPGIVGFSGYHSKDAIVATAMTYAELNAAHFLLFVFPLVGAGITAFYMFRLWFYTFIGAPRDHHVYEHAHEVPSVMWIPLVVLSLFAAFVAVGGEGGPLYRLLSHSEPTGVAAGLDVTEFSRIALPSHAQIALRHSRAGWYALIIAALGTMLAYLFYGIRVLNPADVRRQFVSLHTFLVEKWRFDELYDVMFVRPAHIVGRWCATIDRVVFDGFLHGASRVTVSLARFDRRFDEQIVDGLVNLVSDVTYAFGRSLKQVQTGLLRQYVMFIVVGVVGLWVVITLFAAR
jgi:NADH-quinone oxidoreductase subunit L